MLVHGDLPTRIVGGTHETRCAISVWKDEVQLGVILAEGPVARARSTGGSWKKGVRAPASSLRPHRRSPTEEELVAGAPKRAPYAYM